jgi:hypothetical protein
MTDARLARGGDRSVLGLDRGGEVAGVARRLGEQLQRVAEGRMGGGPIERDRFREQLPRGLPALLCRQDARTGLQGARTSQAATGTPQGLVDVDPGRPGRSRQPAGRAARDPQPREQVGIARRPAVRAQDGGERLVGPARQAEDVTAPERGHRGPRAAGTSGRGRERLFFRWAGQESPSSFLDGAPGRSFRDAWIRCVRSGRGRE